LQRFVLDALRFGAESGDATIGIFTWNQVSGLAAGVAGIAAFLWLGSVQPVVSEEEDARLAGAAPISTPLG
jgi:hypothetical protein